jgi:hypothetical protein
MGGMALTTLGSDDAVNLWVMGGMALTTLGSDDAVNIWWSNARIRKRQL